MAEKRLPFTREQLERIIRNHPTPFHIYDEKAIRENARALKKAFSWAEGFREHFAVKACPNPHILAIMKDEGFGADCSSMAELVMSEKVGITGEQIMFTSNDTPSAEYVKAKQLGRDHQPGRHHAHRLPAEDTPACRTCISFRYNPGPLREGNLIIGKPEQAKYGFTRDQLFEGYRIARDRGVKRFGLHAMVVSNELNLDYHLETARMLFDLVAEITRDVGIRIEFVNLGGGFGIPYKPEQTAIDWQALGSGVRTVYEERVKARGLHPAAALHGKRQGHHGALRLAGDAGAPPEAHVQGFRRPGRLHGQSHAARALRRLPSHHRRRARKARARTRSTTSPARCARTTTSSPSTARSRKSKRATSS